jgi:hypothetical protein
MPYLKMKLALKCEADSSLDVLVDVAQYLRKTGNKMIFFGGIRAEPV